MIPLAGAVLAVALLAVAQAYFLVGQGQHLLTYGEQLLETGRRLLAAVPGRSAPRTTAPDNIRPRAWWERLRALDAHRDDDVEQLQRLDTDYDAAPHPEPPAASGPATVPAPALHLAGGARLRPRPPVDDVDAALARFTYAHGHRPGHPTGQETA